jgi:hypothetical protein
MNRNAVLSLLVSSLVAGSAGPAFAQTQTINHRFRFFLHPDLVGSLTTAELQSRLAMYVEDLNLIFGKNTIRRFLFDPGTDITITDTMPEANYYGGGELPETNYEIWALVNPAASTPYTFSHGGYMGFSTNGAGAAVGLYWDAVHNRNALIHAAPDDWDLWNYWRQLDTLAHEFGHVFGAGVGEYYSLRSVPDTTGLAPRQDIFYPDYGPTTDPYWSQHPDYWRDPMLVWAPSLSWTELTNLVRFANVTAAMINAGYRNVFPISRYVPDLSATQVRVMADPHTPFANTPVKAWKVVANSPDYTAEQIFDGVTGSDGRVQFAWSGGPDNYDNLMLIKAWPAVAAPMVRWFSFYDAQEQKMVFGKTNLEIVLLTTPGPLLSIQAAGNAFAISWAAETAGFALEATASLTTPNWQAVNQVPTTNGSSQSVTVTRNGEAQFFRLRKQ